MYLKLCSPASNDTEVHGCSYCPNALCGKMSDSIFHVWPLIAFKSPHPALPFWATCEQADKKAQVLPPLVLVGRFKPCQEQQRYSNRAGAPTLAVSSSHNYTQGHLPFFFFPQAIFRSAWIPSLIFSDSTCNTYPHILLVCVASSVSTSDLIWVEAHPIYVSDHNTL